MRKILCCVQNFKITRKDHSGIKPYKCKYCEKSFAVRGEWIIHEKLHSDDRPFKCQFCEKCFKTKLTRKKHERIHTGEKPYNCEICSMRFNQKRSLISHKRIHTGEKPFQCSLCNNRFADSKSYWSHVKGHTTQQISNNKSTNQKSLTNHRQLLRTSHNDKYCIWSLNHDNEVKLDNMTDRQLDFRTNVCTKYN